MILITKEEKMLLEKLFPNYKFPRTMKQKSHRHRYYCVEDEELMRAIADTNDAAREFVEEYDKRAELREARRKWRNRNRRENGGAR